MKKYKSIFILLNLGILLILFNKSLLHKEDTLASGTLVLLELAPVDPRSLMQGDYMRLDYAIVRENSRLNYKKSNLKSGYCVIEIDHKGIARKKRLQANVFPKSEREYSIRFNSKSFRGIKIGAESYFFEEGTAEKYEKAKYGGLMVDDKGNSILVGLFNEELEEIK